VRSPGAVSPASLSGLDRLLQRQMLLLFAQHFRRRLHPAGKAHQAREGAEQRQILQHVEAIGEPLLHPELRQILEWLYRINPTVSVRVTTNGTALTAQKAAWFAGHLDWLSVSLNASDGETHMRDMFPHLAERGIDAEKRWELHLRHIAEFVAALPAQDRPRVRLNMIAHRYNIEDITDFIHVVQQVGSSHATITNIMVHPNIVSWSLYGVRDLYNEAIDAAPGSVSASMRLGSSPA